MQFVLDASVTLAWFIDRPTPAYAKRVRELLLAGDLAVVPSVWQFEIANGFVTAERRRVLAHSDLARMLEQLDIVLRSIEIKREHISIRRLVAEAREYRLTAYDAAYLDLARDEHAPIATLDLQLGEAARNAKIPLLS
jgi:predicted nucleic acid-binding protein